jgi:hypothetical protein
MAGKVRDITIDLAIATAAERLPSRALSRVPTKRLYDFSQFASCLSGIEIRDKASWVTVGKTGAAAEHLIDEVLQRVGYSGKLLSAGLRTAPKASVTHGAAGIAYALCRLAGIRDDTALLSLAGAWCTKAESALGNKESYYNPDIEISPETVGRISPYHTASGVHAVRAFVSHAMGDTLSCQSALSAFISTSDEPCESLDLTLGLSGTLLVCSLLHEFSLGGNLSNQAPLLEFGRQTCRQLWQKIDGLAPTRECPQIIYLGIAHGWAGILYATLCWCRSSGAELPGNLEELLQELAQCAETVGQGVRWPWVIPNNGSGPKGYMPGWCNGTAGYVFLWTAAYRTFRDMRYLRLAEKAGWNAWESAESTSILCCGLAGQAYAMLNLYKVTGEQTWLGRAKMLAMRAAFDDQGHYASTDLYPESLYKGQVGIALLVADLSRPEAACMPFFERSDWT